MRGRNLLPIRLAGLCRNERTHKVLIETLLVILVAAGTMASAFARSSPCTAAASCGDTLALAAGGNIRYFHSLPLTQNAAVRRALIVVHGNGRNADDYYDYAIAAAKLERQLDFAVVLAPNFRTRDDGPAPNEHYWSSHGWKGGDRSLGTNRISSFAVMDELLARICGSRSAVFPNLRVVVIAGHSAGGQFVARYVAGGAGCTNTAVEVRYLVMNPSSYLYVDGRRRAATGGLFETPRSSCDDYDDYKYGLRKLNWYMRRVGPGEIRRRLFTRKTWYIAGEADTGAGRSLDQSCEAMLQGANRLERYGNYRDYAALFEDWTGAEFLTVPGIGHSGRKMLKNEVTRRVIFR